MNEVLDEKSLELVVSNEQLGSLTTNAEKIRDLVKARIAQYNADNYDASNIAQAKSDKALLNKAKKALNDKRKDLEKKFMQPFQGFKEVMNETVGLIDTAVKGIDSVVKAEDQKEKDQKREQIEHIAEEAGLEKVGVKLSLIFDEKWLNKTVSLKKVKEDIEAKVAEITNNLNTLKSFSEDFDTLATRYRENLDFNATIAFANELKAQRETKKPQPEAEQEKSNEQPSEPKEEQKPHVVDDAIDAFADALGQGIEIENEPSRATRMVEITSTEDDFAKVVSFMEDNGITFEIK